MNFKLSKVQILTLLVPLFGVTGCDLTAPPVGSLQTESRSVQLGDAKSAQVEIKMRAGELKVAGGASGLLDGQFTYNVASWKPDVEYNVSSGKGRLTIQQSSGPGGTGHGARNEWDLRFGNQVPIELTAELGAGRADLTLGSLALRQLRLEIGAGETVVDLTGDWKNDLEAHIQGGVGKATIRLPCEVGVRVKAQGGIGAINAHELKRDGEAYINDAYGKSRATLHVDVEGGIGEINLELSSGPPVV
jgi:uncharacterized protein DUF2154